MIKLVRGVVNFHENVLPGLRTQFAQLAKGQTPDVLMVACSDSRVAPNLFASTDPGDVFVVRNPGNLIPPIDSGLPRGDSEAAAVEIALGALQVGDIIVCGHSGCAGMATLLDDSNSTPNLRLWIQHGESAKEQLMSGKTFDASLSPQDQLSQLNVISQIENLKTYPQVAERLTAGSLRLHGWWFDVATGNVYAFEPEAQRFVVIDQEEGERILWRLGCQN
jgi:carbonic anhydrase